MVMKQRKRQRVPRRFYDEDAQIVFDGRVFCFTGQASMPRRELAEIVTARGGIVRKDVSGRTDYLVVGHRGSRYWLHRRYGRKIEAAIKYQRRGSGIAVVRERVFWKWV